MNGRYLDWRSRLDAFLAERAQWPFRWGENDCCLFVADAVIVETGQDVAADLRGTYRNMAEAVLVLRLHGGVARLAKMRLGEEIAPQLAQVGDVGLIDQEGRATLALCAGTGWLAPSEGGLGRVPFHAASRAWRVG